MILPAGWPSGPVLWIGIVLLAQGVGLLCFLAWSLRPMLWPTATGVVTGVSIEKDGDYYVPRVEYTYTVPSRENPEVSYSSSRFWGTQYKYDLEDSAAQDLFPYSPGMVVTVRHNPTDPRDAIGDMSLFNGPLNMNVPLSSVMMMVADLALIFDLMIGKSASDYRLEPLILITMINVGVLGFAINTIRSHTVTILDTPD